MRKQKKQPKQDNVDIKQYNHNVNIIPRNIKQKEYVNALIKSNTDIIFASGPAGTGKTMLAMMSAIKHYQDGDIDKIVCTRPAIGVDNEKHGFLPGDLNQKMEPWTRPLFDVLHEYYSPKQTAQMLEEQIIEISPLAYMRGRTFKNAYIIADEMQNATPGQMKMLLTRIGEGSKIVVTGDISQADRKEMENGLLDFMNLSNIYGDNDHIQLIEFSHKDIERHPAVSAILKIYGDIQ